MPATTPAQQRLMAQAFELKKGNLKLSDIKAEYRSKIKDLADKMTLKQLEDFAKTKHSEMKESEIYEDLLEAQEYSNTDDVKTPPPVDKAPNVPPGYEESKKTEPITPSLFKAPMGKSKHERRVMDFNEFLGRINYHTHDDIVQRGHGQNLGARKGN